MPIPFIIDEPVEQLLLWEEGVVELEAHSVAVLLAVEVVAPDRLAVWIDDDFEVEGVSNVPPPPAPEVVVVKLLSGFGTESEVAVDEVDVKAVIVVPSQMAGTPFTLFLLLDLDQESPVPFPPPRVTSK